MKGNTQQAQGFRKSDRDDQLSDYVFGKVPPQALSLEEAVLGAVMLDREAIGIVSAILTPEIFYTQAHSAIFGAFLKLYGNYQPIDLLSVMEQLKKSGELEMIGGPAYLTSLTNKVASAANIEYHSRIIYQKFIRREIIRIAGELTRNAFDDTVDDFDLLDDAERSLFRITGDMQGQTIKDAKHISEILLKTKEQILLQPEGVIGVPCGLESIDRLTNGFQAPDLWIIAARPGMGKSAIITSFARQQAIFRGIPVGIFSLEMSAEQHQKRIAAAEADIPNNLCQDPRKMNSYQLQAYDSALDRIAQSPIYYNDTPSISVMQLKSKAREMVRKYGVKVIYIDYLQLMSVGDDSRGNREQEISHISRSLKALAKELNIPVIALSQLSRAVEIRGGSKRPQLSDLRESGSLEQDSDNVVFLYRPEYYGITEDPNGNSLVGVCEFIIAKHRNGRLDTIPIRFKQSRVLFSDLTSFDFEAAVATPVQQPSVANNAVMVDYRPDVDEDLPF